VSLYRVGLQNLEWTVRRGSERKGEHMLPSGGRHGPWAVRKAALRVPVPKVCTVWPLAHPISIAFSPLTRVHTVARPLILNSRTGHSANSLRGSGPFRGLISESVIKVSWIGPITSKDFGLKHSADDDNRSLACLPHPLFTIRSSP